VAGGKLQRRYGEDNSRSGLLVLERLQRNSFDAHDGYVYVLVKEGRLDNSGKQARNSSGRVEAASSHDLSFT
jgi:hypothetical protein